MRGSKAIIKRSSINKGSLLRLVLILVNIASKGISELSNSLYSQVYENNNDTSNDAVAKLPKKG